MVITLENICDLFKSTLGEQGVSVIEFLYENDEVSEFEISDAICIPVAQVRSLLYELESKSLVRYEKKKDKNKGWYLYYWYLRKENFNNVFYLNLKRKLQEYEMNLEKERSGSFCVCSNGCKRVSFEEALSNGFVCPVCYGFLEHDCGNKKKELEKKIDFCKKILASFYSFTLS